MKPALCILAAVAVLASALEAPPSAAASPPPPSPPATGKAGPLGLTTVAPPSDERVEIQLPQSIVFDVTDLAASPIAATSPFALSFRGARLAPGRTLRIAARLEAPLPPGAAVAFRGRDPRGGTCGAGRVSAATFTAVFTGAAATTSGGCELAWTLTCGSRIHRAGRYALSLRWQIESALADRDAALATARAALPPFTGLAPLLPAPGHAPTAGTAKTGAATSPLPWPKSPGGGPL